MYLVFLLGGDSCQEFYLCSKRTAAPTDQRGCIIVGKFEHFKFYLSLSIFRNSCLCFRSMLYEILTFCIHRSFLKYLDRTFYSDLGERIYRFIIVKVRMQENSNLRRNPHQICMVFCFSGSFFLKQTQISMENMRLNSLFITLNIRIHNTVGDQMNIFYELFKIRECFL